MCTFTLITFLSLTFQGKCERDVYAQVRVISDIIAVVNSRTVGDTPSLILFLFLLLPNVSLSASFDCEKAIQKKKSAEIVLFPF